MKKIIGLLSFATLMLAGCSVEESKYLQDNAGVFPIFYASFDDTSELDTKTYVENKFSLRWTKDDRLSVFAGNTYNCEYKYDGETGADNGTFSVITSAEVISGEALQAYYAVYPYNVSHEINPKEGLSVVLPFVQNYAENSFGLEANTMVAVTENKEDNFLQFKNICGYVVVKLYGEGTVTSIKLEGNNGEKISGKANVYAEYGVLPSVAMSEEATTSITLDCGEGVTIGTTSETATEFWFCIPPVTFSKGFSIIVTDTSGGVMEKSISSSMTITRNTIDSMVALNAEFSGPAMPIPEAIDLGLPSGIKWASFNLGATKPEEYGGYYQWAGLEDVTSKSVYLDWSNCPYHSGSNRLTGWTKYVPLFISTWWSGQGSPDNKTVLDMVDDVAYMKLGGKWRMPTYAEWIELMDNCTWTWTTLNGVKGTKLTSKRNGNSIFLPAAGERTWSYINSVSNTGYYWSSSLFSDTPLGARASSFSSNKVLMGGYLDRYCGFSVRPVSGEGVVHVTEICLSKSSASLAVGQYETLTDMIFPSNATDKNVNWTSNNSGVATVDNNGKVTAIKPGSATITVTTTDGGYTATCQVLVDTERPNVPDAIDLGLPSGIKWATYNIGATKPEEYGGFYQWAGLQDVKDTTFYLGEWEVCPYHSAPPSSRWTKYVPSNMSGHWSGSGSPDNKTVLDLEDDVAHVTLGGKWRMPTEEEGFELRDNCVAISTTLNGIKGTKLTSMKNGNSIFLPAPGIRDRDFFAYVGSWGYYWTSTLETDSVSPAWATALDFSIREGVYDSFFVSLIGEVRTRGLSVRPVTE